MISTEYLAVLQKSRAECFPYWGGGGARHAPRVVELLAQLGASSGTILDYGSGVGMFAEEVVKLRGPRYRVTNYEPTLPQWAELPALAFDAVVCTHVLEHIEPALLSATLEEIRARARRLIYIEVPHREAKETLADGRNAHLIIEPAEWWRDRLVEVFPDAVMTERPSMFKTQTQFELLR